MKNKVNESMEYQIYVDKLELLNKLGLKSKNEVNFRDMLFILFGNTKYISDEEFANSEYKTKKVQSEVEMYLINEGFWDNESKRNLVGKFEIELSKFDYEIIYNSVMADIIYEFYNDKADEIIQELNSRMELRSNQENNPDKIFQRHNYILDVFVDVIIPLVCIRN